MRRPSSSLSISRRRFNTWVASVLLTGMLPGVTSAGVDKAPKLKVAAIQMVPKLGDLQANLEQAEQLIRQAQKRGAQWIVLPEMFTTAAAFHPGMLAAIQPVDGAPARMMARLARQGASVIGGSYLASREGDAYNSFLLVFPDGRILRHDKDQPTYWENCFYRGGRDDGVLEMSLDTLADDRHPLLRDGDQALPEKRKDQRVHTGVPAVAGQGESEIHQIEP